ncbi:hypothetical protein CDL12_18333 [Handroanthus impetiginosus]|uniref:Myb/SANT-like domain-containing protein n=1 Tax=Handroanthus impetiginosus TaxID=429701 RepID=A0A2G9GUX2_9LAMI|nr:hypothetical protein CDL12_18333 [Handroanthus impetiginosus]
MEQFATSSRCMSKVRSNPKSPPAQRRYWTSDENLYLIRCLKLLHAQGGGAEASWDPNTNMIVTDSDLVWDEYIRVHPKAASLRGQPQPLYESWIEIFVDVGDALNELLYCSGGTNNDSCQDNAHETPASTPRTVPDDIIDDAISISPPSTGTQTALRDAIADMTGLSVDEKVRASFCIAHK